MTGENTSQNNNNGWSLFHRTTSKSDKKLVNCNTVKGKFEPSDKCLFHKDISYKLLANVEHLLSEEVSKVRLGRFR